MLHAKYLFRRIFCGRCRTVRVILSLWCVCVVLLVVLLSLSVAREGISRVAKLISCDNEESEAFLQNLCVNYTKGLTSGSLCYPLCTDEIVYTECLGHGVKPHVLKANWKGTDVILKVKRQLHEKRVMWHLTDLQPHMMDREYFNINVNLSFINNILNKDLRVAQSVFDYLYAECAGDDGKLTYHEIWYCYALFESDEFLLSVLLRDYQCVPKLYGVCGNVFVVEYIPVEQLEALPRLIVDERSWAIKAKLGLALLDLVKRLDETPYGTLYLCDIQFTNFGAYKSETSDGYVVKPIDVDIAWLSAQMKEVMNGGAKVNCTLDADCHFVSCLGRCDHKRQKCYPHSYSNNLINICRLIFSTPYSVPKFGLFDSAPPTLQPRLAVLIKKCAMPSVTPWPRTSHVMIEQFRHLLHESIRQNIE